MTPIAPAAHLASIGDLSVLFVMATEREYGEHLRHVITPVITGVGPVEAAAETGAVLGALQMRGMLPDLVFSLGSAGSRTRTCRHLSDRERGLSRYGCLAPWLRERQDPVS